MPEVERALYSSENAVTLLFEGHLQPYKLDGPNVKTNEMHVHELPWPQQVLEDLGGESVQYKSTRADHVDPGHRGARTSCHTVFQTHIAVQSLVG